MGIRYTTEQLRMGFPTQWEHTDSFRLETRNNYLSPGQLCAAGVFFNAEVPEIQPSLLLSVENLSGQLVRFCLWGTCGVSLWGELFRG